jgi:hypothetical protein
MEVGWRVPWKKKKSDITFVVTENKEKSIS